VTNPALQLIKGRLRRPAARVLAALRAAPHRSSNSLSETRPKGSGTLKRLAAGLNELVQHLISRQRSMTGFVFVDLSPRPWEQPGFRRFWMASTVSAFGTPVTGLAVQILVVVNLQASNVEVGVVRTAQWLPYLAFGLFAGALVDRIRRRLSVLWL
jgi:hypothetical protein